MKESVVMYLSLVTLSSYRSLGFTQVNRIESTPKPTPQPPPPHRRQFSLI